MPCITSPYVIHISLGKPYEPEPYTAPVQSTAVSGSTTERDLSPAKRSKTGDKASKDKDKEKLTVGDGASAAPSVCIELIN